MIFFMGLIMVGIATGFLTNSIPLCFLVIGIGFILCGLLEYFKG